MRASTTSLAAVLVLCLPLAACGGDGDEGGAGREAIAVTETDFEITPRDAAITEPGEFRFRVENSGQSAHGLAIEGAGEMAPIEPGETGTLDVALEEGAYTWYCQVGDHRARGMEGAVRVGAPRGEGGPDTAGPSSGGASGY